MGLGSKEDEIRKGVGVTRERAMPWHLQAGERGAALGGQPGLLDVGLDYVLRKEAGCGGGVGGGWRGSGADWIQTPV